MAWLIVLALLLLLLLGTALISGLVFYVQFSLSPEKAWRNRVLDLLAAAGEKARAARRDLDQAARSHEAEVTSLQDEAFRAYLTEVSVDELEGYSGIGPATVEKLRGASYRNLEALRNAHRHVPGLGDKRWADIDHAVRDLIRKARSTFDAGGCRPARALAEQLTRLAAKYDCLKVRSLARATAAGEIMNRLRAPAAVARQVTFWRWFRPITAQELVSAEVMEAALPDLEAAVRAADAWSAQAWEAKSRGAGAAGQKVAVVLPADPVPAPRAPPARSNAVQHAEAPGRARPAAHDQEGGMVDDSHLAFMDLTIQFAFGLARADGPVKPAERDLIRQHVRRRFGYDRALLNRAESLCAHYESAAIDPETCFRQINQRFTAAHRSALVEFAGQIVTASGQAPPAAGAFLQALAKRLGVPLTVPASPNQPTAPIAPPRPATSRSPVITVAAPPASPAATVPAATAPSPPRAVPPPPAPLVPPVSPPAPVPNRAPAPTREECLALLEIPLSTPLSADLVRRQWNLLAQRFAPDKVAAMGPDFLKMAQAKLLAVRRAAETLLKPMGEPLEIKPAAPAAPDPRHNPDLDDVFGGM